eukprot:349642-Chlamydomonas_euryale.AAC.3
MATWHGTAWHGTARPGTARHGMAWHGIAWHGVHASSRITDTTSKTLDVVHHWGNGGCWSAILLET